jgi:hypothetical protein
LTSKPGDLNDAVDVKWTFWPLIFEIVIRPAAPDSGVRVGSSRSETRGALFRLALHEIGNCRRRFPHFRLHCPDEANCARRGDLELTVRRTRLDNVPCQTHAGRLPNRVMSASSNRTPTFVRARAHTTPRPIRAFVMPT